ncbi:MAG: hypothetical protein DME55_02140 [Verrucomicrobia bacterium]|nr:MAG: hypothetical protein DME55_02140 [Verrucomicrobiota bacterium]
MSHWQIRDCRAEQRDQEKSSWFHSICFEFVTPYKGKKSGAFQKKWLRQVKWLNREALKREGITDDTDSTDKGKPVRRATAPFLPSVLAAVQLLRRENL